MYFHGDEPSAADGGRVDRERADGARADGGTVLEVERARILADYVDLTASGKRVDIDSFLAGAERGRGGLTAC